MINEKMASIRSCADGPSSAMSLKYCSIWAYVVPPLSSSESMAAAGGDPSRVWYWGFGVYVTVAKTHFPGDEGINTVVGKDSYPLP
jgi:hypothetical protein